MPLPATDGNGIITEGRFAGMKLDEVFDFATTMATPGSEERSPEQRPPTETPAEKLARESAARVSPMDQFTLSQFEAQDEAAFRATVSDYDEFAEDIKKVKGGMHPMQRAQTGAHRFIYLNLKVQKNAELQKTIFGAAAKDPPPAASPEESPEGEVQPPAPPPPPAAAPPPPPPPAARAVPPSAPPTPAARAAVPGVPPKTPKLKATPKTLALAERWGMPINDYLLKLEEQGVTQDTIDTMSVASSSRTGEIRSIYDR